MKLIGYRVLQDHGSAWITLWDMQHNDMWDRGKPSPASIDLIEQRGDLFRPLAPDGRHPFDIPRVTNIHSMKGSGHGYDVVMLALHGFDAYGVEISATGVAAAQSYASKELQSPQAQNFGEQKSGCSTSPGRATFIEGDFFDSDWEPRALEGGEAYFDIIYDYTFLCALHPDMRRQWSERMAELLRSDGYLVCLEFPLYKDPALPGPPWGLQGVHWNLLVQGGDGIVSTGTAPEIANAGQLSGAFKRVLFIEPVRSYDIGKGTDMLSVYAPK
ncbi:hypothetical protein UA08_09135 [Talaromyces atroroseus]|uniref:Methyltransferase domain-containing protein n=1 Tax=Talaromyces atroroseus TaxID=1441469 RepID=A0A1Q5Q6X4_TALAT|nr:hypothetical protein UA08_09135 [Talaromyces atroroseus]OKL55595.1 hypothetical protein UA08_09135 [Talaromyces atroroseus]